MFAALACGVASACLLPIGGTIAARSLLNSSGGTRVDDGGALLVGVAMVPPSGDPWLDHFLGLPDEALAMLRCSMAPVA